MSARTCHTSHESFHPLFMFSIYCLLLSILLWCLWCCILFWDVLLSFFFFLSSFSLSLVVCENREEPWSWFQHLWWHQWPGEPLQTLWHGTTRPSLPANHSVPGFTSELPWKLLLVTAVFRVSVCLSVCGAAVDLVNFESVWVCGFVLKLMVNHILT